MSLCLHWFNVSFSSITDSYRLPSSIYNFIMQAPSSSRIEDQSPTGTLNNLQQVHLMWRHKTFVQGTLCRENIRSITFPKWHSLLYVQGYYLNITVRRNHVTIDELSVLDLCVLLQWLFVSSNNSFFSKRFAYNKAKQLFFFSMNCEFRYLVNLDWHQKKSIRRVQNFLRIPDLNHT